MILRTNVLYAVLENFGSANKLLKFYKTSKAVVWYNS